MKNHQPHHHREDFSIVEPNLQATYASSLTGNRLLPAPSRPSRLHSLAVLTVCALALGALDARAEHYTLQEQVLVSGRQRPDPQQPGELRFVRDRSAGFSTTLGLVHESSAFACSIIAGPNGTKTIVVRGQIVHTAANGDQVFYSVRGTVTGSGYTERDLSSEVIKARVTVTGGNGAFKYASGGGEMTCVVSSDGHFSSQMNVTLSLPGEK